MKACIVGQNEEILRRVYTQRQLDEIEALLGEPPRLCAAQAQPVGNEEIAFSTWGIPASLRQSLPRLRAVFYGAGSVQHFAREMLNANIRVFSAWRANAVPVAEFAFAQILLSAKGYVPAMLACRDDRAGAAGIERRYPGGYRTRVGLLGCGAIGSRVARMLAQTDFETLVFDPYLPDERARELRVTKTSLDEIFETCTVISNHLANLPSTQGIIRREHLLRMRPFGTFINTGRGQQLDENDLYDALAADPTRTALLDVLTDERHFEDCRLRALPNCFFSPHMAGTSGNETERMGEKMVEALGCYLRGEPSEEEVTLTMLDTMA